MSVNGTCQEQRRVGTYETDIVSDDDELVEGPTLDKIESEGKMELEMKSHRSL